MNFMWEHVYYQCKREARHAGLGFPHKPNVWDRLDNGLAVQNVSIPMRVLLRYADA